MSSGPSRAASLALAVACGLLAATAALSQVMYKWTDAHGKTQYSDRPPKDFKGEVTRLRADVEATPGERATPRAAPPPAPAEGAMPAPAADDLNTRRRANRERLETRLARARTRLEAAQRALDEAPGPDVEERQIIQRKVQSADAMRALGPRANCREQVDGAGRKSVMCPTLMPGTAYYERMASLEAALEQAREELEEAERAYRRGRD